MQTHLGAEKNGLLASLNSVAKLPYELALDGISNTQTISPEALGHSDEERTENLVHVLDGYFHQGAHHLNVNVFGTEKLIDAMEHPEKPRRKLYNSCIRLCSKIHRPDKGTADGRHTKKHVTKKCNKKCNKNRKEGAKL